jgi:hypothetical protein
MFRSSACLPAVVVDLHRVVDHQVHRHERLDDLRVLAHLRGDVAHGRQVGQQRHAGESPAARCARPRRGSRRCARHWRFQLRQLLHVLGGDLLAVAVAQHAFQHDADLTGRARGRKAWSWASVASVGWMLALACGDGGWPKPIGHQAMTLRPSGAVAMAMGSCAGSCVSGVQQAARRSAHANGYSREKAAPGRRRLCAVPFRLPPRAGPLRRRARGPDGRRLKNERLSSIAITVDLLTTGLDVPDAGPGRASLAQSGLSCTI